MRSSDQALSRATNRKQTHYVSLEGIRGIAAVWVAVRHMKPIMTPIPSQSSFMAVDIFFMLSGFVLAFSYDQRLRNQTLGFFDLSLLRIIRIYPLYVIASAVGVLAFLLDPASPSDIGLRMLKAILLIPSLGDDATLYPLDYPTWSLFFELAISFLYAGLLFKVRDAALAGLAAIAGVFFFYGIIRHGGADLGYSPDYFLYGFPRIAYSFSIGMLVFRWRNALSKLLPPMGNTAVLVIFAATTVLLIVPMRHQPLSGAPFNIVSLILVVPIVVVAAIQARPSGIVEQAALLLGKISFPLYVFHVPLSAVTIELFRRLAGIDLKALAPLSGIAVLGCFCILSVLADDYIDIPLRRRLRNGLLGRRDPEARAARIAESRAPPIDEPFT